MNQIIEYCVNILAELVQWLVLGVEILASMVGSQAIITRTFSIINQILALGCFLRVKVVHTSDKIYGRIYILEIKRIWMILCLSFTISFQDTKLMGNASRMFWFCCLNLCSYVYFGLPMEQFCRE